MTMVATTGFRTDGFRIGVALVVALILGCAGAARATETVDFSDQPANVALTGPVTYGDATFSSANGMRFFTWAGYTNTALCPHATNACRSTLTIDFATPADNLSFDVYQVDTTGILAISLVGSAGADSFSLTLPRGFGPRRVELTGYSGLTQVILDGRPDEEGMFFDNFRYDLASNGGGAGAVPEPASWAMMIAGFGLTGAMMRRRTALAA
ncbi:hypothetical protein GGQ62_001155 [Polymorphobacter fuscus]|nr:PEPxxWA-CTERM sorting domain-containing protein [Polymorphobacter fuscus]NJC08157.1 hypothetical protein [Polymorphobacter fuscus]